MNKRKGKRLAALGCALLMLCALAGCGETAAPPMPAPTESAAPTAAPEPDTEEIALVTPEPLPEPTAAPTMAPMAPIDPADLPETLDAFLCAFATGYADREGGREFDSRNCVDVRANIVSQLVNTLPCADFSLYPGEAPLIRRAGDEADRQGWTGDAEEFEVFDPAQVEWIAEEIFRLSASDYRAVLSRSINSGAFYRNRNDAGEERFFLAHKDTRRPDTFVRYLSAETNGQDYEIVYDLVEQPRGWLGCYAATLSLREIDGGLYWTLSKHTAAEVSFDETDAPELLSWISGPFALSDEGESWRTELTIAPDGGFVGSYWASELPQAGDDCDQVILYAEFEGRFGRPRQTGTYSYTLDLQSLRYLDEAADYVIVEDDGWRVLYRHADAVGLEDCGLFTVYAPGAPLYRLPDSFVRWYGSRVPLDGAAELPGWGLMNSSYGYGFAS